MTTRDDIIIYQRFNPQNRTNHKAEAEGYVDCFMAFGRMRVSG